MPTAESFFLINPPYLFSEELGRQPPYHVLIHHLAQNEAPNNLIATKVAAVLEQSRFPFLVSDRKDHLELLQELIKIKSPDEVYIKTLFSKELAIYLNSKLEFQ